MYFWAFHLFLAVNIIVILSFKSILLLFLLILSVLENDLARVFPLIPLSLSKLNYIKMIQRIQTLYLSLAIIFLALVTFGSNLFSFLSDTSRFVFSTYGITEYSLENEAVLGTSNFPFYLGTGAIILLCFLCIMSYKNLKRQFKLGRLIFGLYFLMLIVVILLSIYGDQLIDAQTKVRENGLGLFLFIAGFPFTFLANTGIKRDKQLIDSLDRLR